VISSKSWLSKRAEVSRPEGLGARPSNPKPSAASSVKVDITAVKPDLLAFCGQAACFELGLFTDLARAVETSPTPAATEGLSLAAGHALRAHQGLLSEIRRRGADPVQVMAPFQKELDLFRANTSGASWQELVLRCYLVGGLLEDLFGQLSTRLPTEVSSRVSRLFAPAEGIDLLERILRTALTESPEHASILALWGRRLVGDTLLIARSALPPAATGRSEAVTVEPVFTDLIAAHTRRMDVLGLTA
jgi:hypothetical protein